MHLQSNFPLSQWCPLATRENARSILEEPYINTKKLNTLGNFLLQLQGIEMLDNINRFTETRGYIRYTRYAYAFSKYFTNIE